MTAELDCNLLIERSVTTLKLCMYRKLMDKYCTVETYFMVNKHTQDVLVGENCFIITPIN